MPNRICKHVARNRKVIRKRNNQIARYTGGPNVRGPFHNYVAGDPFPISRLVNLHYSEGFQFTSLAAQFGTEQVINLNSLFDPNATGIGHQPYGRDQLALIYGKYKVYAVTVKIEWMDPTEDGMMCAALVESQTSGFSLTGKLRDTVAELPMSNIIVINDSGKQTRTVTQRFKMNNLLGISPVQFEADTSQYSSNFASSPSAMPKLKLSAMAIGGVAGGKVRCQVTLVYHTQVFDRIIQSSS